MKTRFASSLLLPLLLLVSQSAAAQPIINEASITLDAALKAANACETMAKAKGWKVSIWVVDDNGIPVYMKRMDGAILASIDTAQRKAQTARVWLSTTDTNDPNSLVGQTLKTTEGQVMNILMNAFPGGGGVPIFEGGNPFAGGKLIGAIGVGGANVPPDGDCAQAGADAIMKK